MDIDLLVLSHADNDHLKGLAPIIKHPRIHVRRVIHNGIVTLSDKSPGTSLGELSPDKKYLLTRHDSLDDLAGLALSETFESWREALAGEGVRYGAVDSTTGSIDVGDPEVVLEVLGPRLDVYEGKSAYRWFGGEGPTINGHSVTLKLTYGGVSALFPGDLNCEGEKNLISDASIARKLNAHVFKAPHHGSHDYYLPFLKTVRPQISVISSGDDPDYGHPRAVFIGAAGSVSRSAGPLIFAVKIAANFIEAVDKGKPSPHAKLDKLDPLAPDSDSQAKILYKRRLHGMINVRTDGKNLFAARRVMGANPWESYGPLPPSED